MLHRCCRVFYKIKAEPFTGKKITAHFIEILALLGWSGTRPAISKVCLYFCKHFSLEADIAHQREIFVLRKTKLIRGIVGREAKDQKPFPVYEKVPIVESK